MPWINGEFKPYRRNSQGIKCIKCKRIFAGEMIPTDRICKDCRLVDNYRQGKLV